MVWARVSAALAALCLLAHMGTPQAQAADPLKVGILKFGTVAWELDVIAENGLDEANGFTLDLQPFASGAATRVAFEGDAVDVIVADWIWVARRRAAGADVAFIPYSRSVGGVMISEDAKAQSLADLAGSSIGVAGGPLDKSWLILQALALREGMDLKAETEQVFGAPPLLYKKAQDGEIDAVITFWHYMARLEAQGFRRLISTADASEALGLAPDLPLLGYVVKGELARERPDLVKGLANASRAAKRLLAENEAEWSRLRPLMKAKSDAEFAALKAGFLEGAPNEAPVDATAAAAFFDVLAKTGGEELVGSATSLPDGVFLDLGD